MTADPVIRTVLTAAAVSALILCAGVLLGIAFPQ